MNYYKIGQKIRQYRKALGLSQEQVAEQIGISLTHMSHIETGNTKLSLQVLVDIAKTLHVQTDDLLFDSKNNKTIAIQEIAETLETCDVQQAKIITDLVKATKVALDKYDET